MNKIIAVLLLASICAAAPSYCDAFKGFGNSFAGAACSDDLMQLCIAQAEATVHLIAIIKGDMSALMLLLKDIAMGYSAVVNSYVTCGIMQRFVQFMINLARLPVIIMLRYKEIAADIACITNAYQRLDYLKMGACTGDIMKILTSPENQFNDVELSF